MNIPYLACLNQASRASRASGESAAGACAHAGSVPISVTRINPATRARCVRFMDGILTRRLRNCAGACDRVILQNARERPASAPATSFLIADVSRYNRRRFSGDNMRRSCLTFVMMVLCGLAVAQSTPPARSEQPLYRASLVQAAPGKLTDLIAAYKQHFAAAGQTPLWMRHSQGDRWDLLILEPMGSYAEYFAAERVATRDKQDAGWEQRRRPMVAWEEDVFVYGPPESELRKAFSGSGFFHVEMFRELAGKHAD